MLPTLEEAVAWLDEHVGRPDSGKPTSRPGSKRDSRSRGRGDKPMQEVSGYEIILVNDGSKDKTVDVVLKFAKENGLHDVLRVVSLEKNRGKGGGVTHGLRHVRGEYALFADADGASRFSDVSKLIEGCDEVVDGSLRGVAIGSRAHLVGSEAVVKVRLLATLTCAHKEKRINTNVSTALPPPELPHALLPPRPDHPHPASHLAHPRHPMRLQALLAGLPTAHRPLHAR